jgi:AAA+ ATPase superfamily predicted ATPase
MTFYDRAEELDALQTAFASQGQDFYVVYGRRRVGKTALLKEFCVDHPHIYLDTARESRPSREGRVFRRSVGTEDRTGRE